jgi:hypothetical protein
MPAKQRYKTIFRSVLSLNRIDSVFQAYTSSHNNLLVIAAACRRLVFCLPGLHFVSKTRKKSFQLRKHVFKKRHQPADSVYCDRPPGFNKSIRF